MKNSTAFIYKTDSTKCCLWQEVNEELKSPPTSISLEENGYAIIARNVLLFTVSSIVHQYLYKYAHQCWWKNTTYIHIHTSVHLNPSCFDEGMGIGATFRRKKQCEIFSIFTTH